MAKLMVVSETDPSLCVLITFVEPGTPGKAQGFRGECTGCGPRWTMHRWTEVGALRSASHHIDTHGDV